MRLDSWQLQGWGWEEVSPQIAVFTNFSEDHLNYYSDMDEYFKDKAQIFLHQEESGVFITTPEVFKQAQELGGDASIGQEVILVDDSTLPKDWELKIPGSHNRLKRSIGI